MALTNCARRRIARAAELRAAELRAPPPAFCSFSSVASAAGSSCETAAFIATLVNVFFSAFGIHVGSIVVCVYVTREPVSIASTCQ